MTKQTKKAEIQDAEIVDTGNVSKMPVAAEPKSYAVTPMAMIDRALESGAGIETLEKLMALQERYEANNAKREYNAAVADARAEIGPISKNRTVDFTSKNGGSRTNYKFEDLAEIARTVDPVLAKHGLSYRYRTAQNGNTVRVTCVVSHRDGYSEETSLEAPADNSGNKNGIQGIGSTITFLQRYTLKAALGLAVANDDDGQKGGAPARAEPPVAQELTGKQCAELRTLIEETGSNLDLLLKAAGKAPSLEDIHPSLFEKVKARLLEKKATQAAKATATAAQ